jgi:hypothetical protein
MTVPLPLSDQVRGLVRHGMGQLVELLDAESPAPSMKRLFPPAYADADNAEHEAEYRRLMGDDLRRRHRESAEVLLATIDRDVLEDAEAEAWLRALNELRLVIGTILDVSEEDLGPESPDDPTMPAYVLYDLLGQIQEYLVTELAAAL